MKIKNMKFRIGLVSVCILLILCQGIKLWGQNVSVDPSTGAPSIVIPIYTLKYGNISVPVNLVHTGTALGVGESEGDAGFGWNLTTNYGVYRQVRGLPDDVSPGGWLFNHNGTKTNNFVPTSDDNLSIYTDEATDFNTINGLGYTSDTEPDLYSVSAPGLSFQFVYDTAVTAGTGVPRLLNYQDIKITPTSSGFTAQNNIGWTYNFNTQETVTRTSSKMKINSPVPDMFTTEYNYYTTPVQFIQCWHLTSITDEAGNTVTFNYNPSPWDASSPDYKTRIKSTNQIDTLYYTIDQTNELKVNTIVAGNYSVNFTWSSNSSGLIRSIQVNESGLNDSFFYYFNYQTVQPTGSSKVNHFFLSSLQTGSYCSPEAPYTFSYQGITMVPNLSAASSSEMPWQTLFSQDRWGFYNGDTNNQDIPQLFYYSNQTDSRRFSFATISGATLTQTLSGSVRNANSTKIGIGSLSQITYPSGGTAKILWERNKYLDNVTNQVLFGPGLRVASVISDGGESVFGRNASSSTSYHQIRKDYNYSKSDTDTTSSGVLFYPPSHAFATGSQLIRSSNNLGQASAVYYGRVKEIVSGQGSTVTEYSLPALYPSTSYSTDWVATKSKIARNPSTHLSVQDIQNGYYTFPFAPNPNYDFETGLVTRRSEYDESGKLVRQSKYQYTRINPLLQSIYGLKFERLGAGTNSDCDCFHFSKYQIITGTTKVLTKVISSEVSETNSLDTAKVITYYHYNNDVANKNFLMDSVRKVLSDGTVSRTRIRYVKDFATITNPTSTDGSAIALKEMIASNRHGEIVEQYSSLKRLGTAEVIISGNVQLFKDFGNGKPSPYRSFVFPEGHALTPSAVKTGTTQGFSFDTDYRLSKSNDDFDNAGNPASISDNKKNKVAYHNALNYNLGPVAVFSNTTARRTVYDGFEFATGRNLSASGGSLNYSSGWTGQNALNVTSSYVLFYPSVDSVTGPYRISCWMKTAQATNITFKFINVSSGNTVVTSSVLNCQTLNQWTYLEGSLNVSSGPIALRLEITLDGNATVDDILVMPKSASVVTQTYLPLKGVTSQTDDRGNSSTFTYDALGRKVNTFDRQRNLVELDEYQNYSAVSAPSSISADFNAPYEVIAGQPSTFSINPAQNCFSTAAYEWQLDGVIVGSNSPSLTITIATPGTHTLQLKVINTQTQLYKTNPVTLCVNTNTVPPTFTLNASSQTQRSCDSGITFSVTNLAAGCGNNSTVKYQWFISNNNGASYQPLSTAYNTGSPPPLYFPFSYWLKVVVTVTCAGNDNKCPGLKLMSGSATVAVAYVQC